MAFNLLQHSAPNFGLIATADDLYETCTTRLLGFSLGLVLEGAEDRGATVEQQKLATKSSLVRCQIIQTRRYVHKPHD